MCLCVRQGKLVHGMVQGVDLRTVSLFYNVGSGDQTHVGMLGSKCLYLLSCLTSPLFFSVQYLVKDLRLASAL